MLKKIDWGSEIGRRIKLRDLHVFFTVAQHGSMGRAAAKLGVSTPTVSDAIADLEHAVGKKLFDRNPRGVEPTIYGRAILKRGLVAFDELKQGIRDIEFLADPTNGEVRIGCSESVAATILPPIIHQFSQVYPRVAIHVLDVPSVTRAHYRLREQQHDLALAWWVPPLPSLGDDLNVETLFESPLILAVGMHSKWALRRKIDLAELTEEPWVLGPQNTANYSSIAAAFELRNLTIPKINLVTLSVPLRTYLLGKEQYITALPKLIADHHGLKVLPVDLSTRPWSFAAVTIKNRTLSPVVERFVNHVREVAKSMTDKPGGRTAQRRKANVS